MAAAAAATRDAGRDASRAVKQPAVDLGEAEKKASGWMDGVMGALSTAGINKRFIWGIIVVRLLVTPCISFIVLVLFTKSFPKLFSTDGSGALDKTLILVLFTEIAAPSAINSALLFNQRNFMTYAWAKMLFFQYILCAITMVMWTSMGLSYVMKL
ncbi:hypothetical protein STCU_11806 [Strigomonas culicis]|nr:hypothetical protein STCU_11806 [Strigomonas culicis]|eukprot:EPY15733.1 hypothetical protein STCU_11806 [Strigomonas culicis]